MQKEFPAKLLNILEVINTLFIETIESTHFELTNLKIVEQRDDQVLLSYESPRKCSSGHNHALDSKK